MESFKKNRLMKKVQDYSKIVIYGAGYLGKQVANVLHTEKINLSAFIVTKKENDICMGIPVWEFENIKEKIAVTDTLIIIGVTSKYEEEIEGKLVANKIDNYIKISDYIRENSFEYYRDKSQEQYLDEIEEWYRDKYGSDERILGWREKGWDKKRTNRDYNKIIFTVRDLSPRVNKIINCLKNREYSIELILMPDVIKRAHILEDIVETCENIYECKCIEEVMWHLNHSDAFINHIFNANCNDCAAIILKMKSLFPKAIFEQYDVLEGMYTTVSQNELNLERYCMEEAQGVCCRGFETEYLKKYKNYLIRDFVFLDYYERREQSAEYTPQEELSICYVGGIATERAYPGASYACYLELARLCEKNHCHYHMYPSVWDEKMLEEYIVYEKKHKYFHLHKPIPFRELCKELAKYDYGVHPIKKDYQYKREQGYVTNNKFIYATTNKYFDYVEAGLPIISATPEKLAHLFEEKGLLIRWTIEDYDFDELKRRRGEMRESVKKNRDSLCIENQIQYLLDFYKKV